ncbi:carboxypeptidase [Pseudidiomarina atlantica]|uniref:Carboxypeptidase n=1 Tax=Pseudidiomarina atlantica TaxID=1517416 RepID=A0A094IRD3_9GAMM|nr:carboxypeptidase [Pseudidiomarina atlantica]KFZ28374.1 carboxypeptidase [Pseudidiomarina atlantica]
MNFFSQALGATCVAAALLIAPASVALDDHALPTATIAADDVVVTEHRATINGERFEYTATTGTQPVFNDEGEATAALFFTYYERKDVKNRENRPLVISFNGGPGSASVWMHIAYTGPKSLRVDDEGFPIMPYGVKDNPHSILDVADIVFVNPVNTGYSRVLPNDKGEMPSREQQQKMFFGVNADVQYLADWVNTFVTRHERWRSPKYLIGESYGTTRVSGLALELQNRQWMYLNGVILVSPTDIGIDRQGPVKAANRLPYFAAAAWYHDALPADLQAKDLLEVLEEVEAYTLDTYLPALAKGAMLPDDERDQVAAQVARYSGLSEQVVQRSNLDISTSFFWKELLRDRGQTVGRLDSRYLGIDRNDVGDSPDYNSELTSWLHSFTPAINYYLREELGYQTDVKYNMFGPVHPWDRSGDNTGENLRQAMAQNPYLNVLIQSGYYDGATNYFDAKYTGWHIDPSRKMADRIGFKGYRSGHMMYLRAEDLKLANDDLREFIKATVPAEGEAAKY